VRTPCYGFRCYLSLREEKIGMTGTRAIARAGDPFPDISLPRLDGGELVFRDLRGKRFLLFFWGSW
jgi:hypothetical protein